MNPAPITTLYASILALVCISLGLRVAKMRNDKQIGIGDGDDRSLRRAIRVHGNMIENMPLALFLLLLFEIRDPASWQVHAFGGLLTLGRLAHAAGLSKTGGTSAGRLFGMVSTWTVIGLLAVLGIAAWF